MIGPFLSPHEIATFLLDSRFIDKGTADRLEKRIVAYGDTRENDGHKKGVVKSARKAAAVAVSFQGRQSACRCRKSLAGDRSALAKSGSRSRKRSVCARVQGRRRISIQTAAAETGCQVSAQAQTRRAIPQPLGTFATIADIKRQ